ncbi:putative phage associated protein [Neisseria meningitidis NM3042]|nr:putative phage associated protein [Neisseria meningitidis NM3042]EOC64624.1 putative phage associated protein [Neisseria meningitidis NM3042]EOC65729.1 putative phage associated protein [Neisseria meningitidis NM3042]
MNIQLQGHIVGVKKFNGQIEGKSFDYCRLIVATPLDSSKATHWAALLLNTISAALPISSSSETPNFRSKQT